MLVIGYSQILQVFGEVAEGLETLNRINEAYVDEKGRPYKNIRCLHLLYIFCVRFLRFCSSFHIISHSFSFTLVNLFDFF